MKYLSLCSGIEAASQAWIPFGWEPVAFSEIEPFPCAVLAHHYPETPNLGDMTNYHEWPDTLQFDLLAGGTPCQGFSLAGLRKGLDDERSQLSLVFVEIAARYRPRWLVWENVPGVLSSEGGADFATLLAAFTGREISAPETGWKNSGHVDGIKEAYGVAWRVLDAQHCGVPQRRRRVFLVGYLGDWRRAAAVLFEPESLRGDSPPSRETGQRVAGTLTKSALDGSGTCGGDGRESFLISEVTHALTGEGFDASEDGTGRGTPLVPVVSATVTAKWAKGSGGPSGDECQNLIATAFNPQAGGTQTTLGFDLDRKTIGTLEKCQVPAICFSGRARGDDGRGYDREPLITGDQTGTLDTVKPWNVATGSCVRRVTPLECERLQGFTDNFTSIPGWTGWRRIDETEDVDELRALGFKVKVTRTGAWVNDPDGPRYKALGNSWAVPCARWIGERIQMVERMVS